MSEDRGVPNASSARADDTKGAASGDPDQAVRDLIERRAAELRISLASLSRALGKNASYMHHYLRRGSPSYLGERERKAVAARLGLDEAALMHPAVVSSPVTNAAPLSSRDEVPVYLQRDEIGVGAAREFLPRRVRPENDVIAVRMQTGRGRLEPGDVVFLAREPARIGDTVFAIRGRQIAGWGRLMEATDEAVTIAAMSGLLTVPTADSDILRVVAIFTV